MKCRALIASFLIFCVAAPPQLFGQQNGDSSHALERKVLEGEFVPRAPSILDSMAPTQFSSLDQVRNYFLSLQEFQRLPPFARTLAVDAAMKDVIDVIIEQKAYGGPEILPPGSLGNVHYDPARGPTPENLRRAASIDIHGNPLAYENVHEIARAQLANVWAKGQTQAYTEGFTDKNSPGFRRIVEETFRGHEAWREMRWQHFGIAMASQGDTSVQRFPYRSIPKEMFKIYAAIVISEFTWALLSGDPLVLKGLAWSLVLPEGYLSALIFCSVGGTAAKAFFQLFMRGIIPRWMADLAALETAALATEFGVEIFKYAEFKAIMQLHRKNAESDDWQTRAANVKQQAKLKDVLIHKLKKEAWVERSFHFASLSASVLSVHGIKSAVSASHRLLKAGAATALAESGTLPIEIVAEAETGAGWFSKFTGLFRKEPVLQGVRVLYPALHRFKNSLAEVIVGRMPLILEFGPGVATLVGFFVVAKAYDAVIRPNAQLFHRDNGVWVLPIPGLLAPNVMVLSNPRSISSGIDRLSRSIQDYQSGARDLIQIQKTLDELHDSFMLINEVIARPLLEKSLVWKSTENLMVQQRDLEKAYLLWLSRGATENDFYWTEMLASRGVQDRKRFEDQLFYKLSPTFLSAIGYENPRAFRNLVDEIREQGLLLGVPYGLALHQKWKTLEWEIFKPRKLAEYERKVAQYLHETEKDYLNDLNTLRDDAHFSLMNWAQVVLYADTRTFNPPVTQWRRSDFHEGELSGWSKYFADTSVSRAALWTTKNWHVWVSQFYSQLLDRPVSLRGSILRELIVLQGLLLAQAPDPALGKWLTRVDDKVSRVDGMLGARSDMNRLLGDLTGKDFYEEDIFFENREIPSSNNVSVGLQAYPEKTRKIAEIFVDHMRKVVAPGIRMSAPRLLMETVDAFQQRKGANWEKQYQSGIHLLDLGTYGLQEDQK